MTHSTRPESFPYQIVKIAMIALLSLSIAGCSSKPAIPPIESLLNSLETAIATGDEKKLNRCFVEMDSSPQGLQRRNYVLAIINDLFPKPDSPHQNVAFTSHSFEQGQFLKGVLTITEAESQTTQFQFDMEVRMSIAGWKIAVIQIEEITAAPASE